jgi:type I restriction enzyme R subunit
MGVKGEDLFTSLANRLIRLEKQLTEDEKCKFQELSGGISINATVKNLLNAYDLDIMEEKAQVLIEKIPYYDRSPVKEEACRKQAQEELAGHAASTFTGELNDYIDNVRKVYEQIIDIVNQDKVLKAEWDSFTVEKAEEVAKNFKEYIEANKDEILALSIYYDQPHRRREVTYKMIKEVLEKIKLEKPLLAPHYVWEAYSQLEEVNGNSPKSELVALVSLIRRTIGIDKQLTPYSKTVDKNFQTWVFGKQAGSLKFTEEQMNWLRMIKDHIATSFHVELEDLDLTPFDSQGGRGKMYQLFGETMDEIINELNEVLVA